MNPPLGATVDLRDVTLRFAGADHAALSSVSLEITAGEILVILGPSGCGKSTLLRSINRLVVPDSGDVCINGNNVAQADLITLRRSIGYVIQSAGLFPHLKVRENIAFVLSLLALPQAQIDARVDELLQLVRLDPQFYRNRTPASLSGGEAQRVGVARALAAHPYLLLMDEPFGALDPIVRSELQEEIRNIVKQFGTTTIFVTHDVDEALRLADRIVVMDRGTILQLATPLDMLRSPANEQVAALLSTQSIARRLALIPLEAAYTKTTPPSHLTELDLPLHATLDQALNMFLAHPQTAIFRVGEIGTLTFADIAKAVMHEPAISAA